MLKMYFVFISNEDSNIYNKQKHSLEWQKWLGGNAKELERHLKLGQNSSANNNYE